jgi:hypothetical protein
MSLEEGIKGIGLLPKNQWLERFRELFNINIVEPWDKYEVEHREADWENIPLIIPKSVIVLEKKLVKIQNWAKIKHSEIDKLLSNEFFVQLKAEINGDKEKEAKYKEEQTKKIESLYRSIRDLYDLDAQRNHKESLEVKDEEFFNQFLVEMSNNRDKGEDPEFVYKLKDE